MRAGNKSSDVTVKSNLFPEPPFPDKISMHFCKHDNLRTGVVASSTFNSSFLAFGITLLNPSRTPKSSSTRSVDSFLKLPFFEST